MRKELHDQIITDLSTLVYEGTANPLFVEVKKIFRQLPTEVPAAVVLPVSPSVEIIGNDTDERLLGWEIGIYERIDDTGMEVETRIERLENIEGVVFNYLEKIPNNLEHAVTGVHVIAINVQPSDYTYLEVETGLVMYLSISFTTRVILQPKEL